MKELFQPRDFQIRAVFIIDLFPVTTKSRKDTTQWIIFNETRRWKLSRYFVCVDNIAPHFVEGCLVHFNEKINCKLSHRTQIRGTITAMNMLNYYQNLTTYNIRTSFISSEGICGMKSFPVKKQIKIKSSISLSVSCLQPGVFISSSKYSLRTHMATNCKRRWYSFSQNVNLLVILFQGNRPDKISRVSCHLDYRTPAKLKCGLREMPTQA